MDMGLVCDHCDALNDLKATNCAVCGKPVQAAPSSRPSQPSRPAPPAAAAAKDGTATRDRVPREPAAERTCPQCKAEVPPGFRFCGNCGGKLEDTEQAQEGARTLFFGAMQTPNRAKLILIKGEGLDGMAYHLNAAEHVAGREEGAMLFPEDSFLSPRHACFFYEGSQLVVRDEGSVNGVFIRITQPVPLQAQSRFLVGEQLLQFEPCTDESSRPQADKDGTYFYTSPRRPSRFKLLQLMRGGEIGMIYRAPTDSVTLGREGNDINFPDDPYISGQHARINATANGFELVDLGSKNGTFFRVQKPHKLSHGTYLFIGQQLLRVEVT